MRKLLVSFLVLNATLPLSACGGDDEVTPDAAVNVDAAPTPDGAPAPDGMPPLPTTCTCLAMGVDYANGVGTASRVDLPSMVVTQDILPGAVSSDPVVRYQDGTVYLVNRFGADNITVVDPVTWTVTDQFSTGAGSNPQDIAVKGTTGYVVALGLAVVQVWDLTNTATAPTTIPLPTIPADVDGNPDAASIIISGNRAYIALQHLEMFAPAAKGTIVVIDLATNTVVESLDLTNENPGGFLQARPTIGDLLVAETPGFSPMAGCVETIVPGATPTVGGCLATSTALGGYVTSIAPGDDGHVYVATSSSFTEGKLVRFSDDGMVDAVAYSTATQLPTDVAYCAATHQLLANDNNAGGLRVYDAVSHNEVTTTPLDLGLPPGFTGGIVCF